MLILFPLKKSYTNDSSLPVKITITTKENASPTRFNNKNQFFRERKRKLKEQFIFKVTKYIYLHRIVLFKR